MDTIELIGFQGIALLSLAFAIAWTGWQLSRIRDALVQVPRMPLALERMARQTAANQLLVGSPDGRRALLEFALSEAAVASYLDDIEVQIKDMDQFDFDQLRRLLERDDRSMFQKSVDWLKKNPGKLAGKLFDKANDLVKSMVPGLGS